MTEMQIKNDYEEFGRVRTYIAESIKKQTEESTKKSLIDDLLKILLGLEFKSNHSIKSKCLKQIVKKNTNNITIVNNIRYEKHTIENKNNKDWERNWNNAFFRV